MDPFEPEDDYFSRERQIHPIKAAPRPKAGFIPSKSEAKQCVLLSDHPLCRLVEFSLGPMSGMRRHTVKHCRWKHKILCASCHT